MRREGRADHVALVRLTRGADPRGTGGVLAGRVHAHVPRTIRPSVAT